MPTSINGTGTMWYGKALPADDGSVVVTEWITFLWIPLIPLGSRRVIRSGEDRVPWWKYKSLAEHYKVAHVPLHIPHVMKGYAVTLFLVIVFGLGFSLGQ